MANQLKISVIIPCFNEEMRVGEVIKALLRCPIVFEIIAVNDGSTDKTLEILKSFQNKIRIISYPENKGKGFALAEGVRQAKGEIIIFIDAHHLNVKNSHIKTLTNPLIKNKADFVLGTTETLIPGPFWKLTGFRAYFKEDLVPHLLEMEKTRFGVEVYLNEIFKKKRRLVIYPKGLIHLAKPQKMPISQVFDSSLTEVFEITTTLAKMKGLEPKRIKKILDPKKIKSVKAFKKAVVRLKNKEILNLVKKYLLSYLREL